MLRFFHKYQRSVIIYIFIGIILLSMLFFGTDMFNTQASQYAIKVNDEEVSYIEVAERKRLVENQMQRQFGSAYESLYEALQKNMEQQVIDGIIDERLVAQLIKKQGLMAHDNRLREAVLNLFGGNFSKETYESYLRQTGQSAMAFENKLASQVTQQQFYSILNDFVNVSKYEAKIIAQKEEASYDLEFVTFSEENARKSLKEPSIESLEEYYGQNLNKYELPKRVKYSALVVKPENVLDQISIAEEDVEAYYIDHQSEYLNPERVRVAHIQINFGKDNTPEAINSIREKAQNVYQKAQNGEDFNLLVLQNSDDLITKGIEGSLGWIEKGTRSGDQVEQAVLKLKEPGIAELVETNYGFHILKVLEYQAGSPKDIKSVENKIKEAIRKLEAPAYALLKAEELAEKLKSGTALSEIAKNETKYEYFSGANLLKESEELNPSLTGLTAKVLELGQGQPQVIIDLKEASVLVHIEEYKESETPSFEAVKNEVLKDLNNKLAREQTEELANNFYQKVKAGESSNFGNLAKESSLKVEELKAVKANSTASILENFDIKNSVFRKSSMGLVGEKAFTNKKDFIVVNIKNITLPQPDSLSKPIDEYLNNSKEENFETLRTALLKDLKAKSTVDVISGLITQ